MAFNIDAPTLEQIVLIVLAIVALVAVVAWSSHRRRQRSRTRWITDKLKQRAIDHDKVSCAGKETRTSGEQAGGH
jgi:FtsZ-interacting cell division protein ZipA